MPMKVRSPSEAGQAVGRAWWQPSAVAPPGRLPDADRSGAAVGGFGGVGLSHIPPVLAGQAGAVALGDRPPDRRQLFGRLAGVFFAGAGVLGLVTLPLPAPGSDAEAMAAVYAVALALGTGIWLAPWDRWPRRASLAIVPPAFTLIAVGNAFGGRDLHTYGVFFVVAFVWVGIAHPWPYSGTTA